jgi:hypothetical protein
MFDQIFKMIQSQGLESVINNPAVPNEHNEGVLQAAGGSIMDTLNGMMAGGQTDQIAALAGDPAHPAMQQMQNGFVEQMMQKFGISGEAAKNIAGSLIPSVMQQLGQKGQGGFDLSSIGSMLGKTGLDKDGDGDVDLGDVKKMFGF